jgi:hypothetical protein
MNINKLQDPFPPHKITLKSINKGLCAPSPSKALEYIMTIFEDVNVIIDKQRMRSITITIRCSNQMYNIAKLNFVKDMGRDFLWKD